MAAITHNLWIEQGATWDYQVFLRLAIALRCGAAGTVTELQIRPLPVAIPLNTILDFGCARQLTVAATLSAGGTDLTVSPWQGELSANETCPGPAIDLSLSTYECQIRADYEAGTVLASPSVTGDALGVLRLTLSHSQTTALASTLTREELPTGDPNILCQDKRLLGAWLWSRSHVYSVEQVTGLARHRILEGRVFVAREVVRV